jgi:uncharacterized protein YndB with AHSA1/START domain
MPPFEAVQHVSVTIDRAPGDVYAFVANPENLPRWAAGLSSGIRRVAGEWIADSPMGPVKVRFAAPNAVGVLDHDVVLPSGEVVHNPLRVVPNGSASEVTFTLFQRPGMTQQQFVADAVAVRRDLATLKQLLEAP